MTERAGSNAQGVWWSQRRSLVATVAFIVLLHLAGWGVLLGLVLPQQLQLGGQVMGVGLHRPSAVDARQHLTDRFA